MESSTTMDDINAKREARRRRILENSESRLRKITSRFGPDETKDMVDETNTRKETKKIILESLEECLHMNTARPNLDENKEDNKPQVKNDGVKSNLEECTVRNGTCNIENNRHHLHHYSIFNENKHEELDERYSSDIDDRNIWSSEQIFDEKICDKKSCTYLSYPINLIILAAIVNILLVLKLDDWFGKAVFIPYLLLIMGRLCNFEKLQETKCNTLISVLSTVILWKIKPRLISKLKALLILFSIIINDFCLYTFSFVLMHYFVSTCVTMTMS